MRDEKLLRALKNIRGYIEAYENGHYTIVQHQELPNFEDHTYSIAYIMERFKAYVDEAMK